MRRPRSYRRLQSAGGSGAFKLERSGLPGLLALGFRRWRAEGLDELGRRTDGSLLQESLLADLELLNGGDCTPHLQVVARLASPQGRVSDAVQLVEFHLSRTDLVAEGADHAFLCGHPGVQTEAMTPGVRPPPRSGVVPLLMQRTQSQLLLAPDSAGAIHCLVPARGCTKPLRRSDAFRRPWSMPR